MAGHHGLSGSGWGSGRGSTQSSRPQAPLLPAGAVGDPALGPGRGQAWTDRSPGAPPRLGITPGPGTRGGAPRLGGPLGPTRCDCGALGTLPQAPPPPPPPQDGPSLMPCLGKDPVGTQHVRSVSRPALMVASLPGLARLWVSGSCSLHDPAALPPSQRCSRGPASGPAREWAHGG